MHEKSDPEIPDRFFHAFAKDYSTMKVPFINA